VQEKYAVKKTTGKQATKTGQGQMNND